MKHRLALALAFLLLAGGLTPGMAAAAAGPTEEYDWILRTDGLRTQTVTVLGLHTVTCSFSLMAQKAGGTAPSSDPAFNGGIRTPYAATAFYSMKKSMGSVLDEIGLASLASGTGGVEMTMRASAARFWLDTGAANFALASFTLPMQTEGSFGATVTGDTGSGSVSGKLEETSLSGQSSLTVRLKKSGGGYVFVLVGSARRRRPGIPAMLRRLDDPDRLTRRREADLGAERPRPKPGGEGKPNATDDGGRWKTGAGSRQGSRIAAAVLGALVPGWLRCEDPWRPGARTPPAGA